MEQEMERVSQQSERVIGKTMIAMLVLGMAWVLQSRAALAAGKEFVLPGKKNVSLSLSGQVNRALLITNDGEDTDFFNVDNDNSSTRFRVVGKYAGDHGFSTGVQIEVEMESNSTGNVNQESKRGVGGSSFTERKLEIYFDHDQYGRLWLGQGDTSSNGTSEVDLSGTALVIYSSVCDLAGGILFRDENAGTLSGTSVCEAFNNLDGISRDDRVRYDTPSFGGAKFSTSLVTDSRWDMALRYGGKFGELKTAAAVAYAKLNKNVHQLNGSVSLRHTSGANVTLAAGQQLVDHTTADPSFFYVKLGYSRQFSKIGDTSFAVDYFYGSDKQVNDDEAQSVGAGLVQKVDSLSTELYIGLRHYDLDRKEVNLDSVFAVLVGARIKF